MSAKRVGLPLSEVGECFPTTPEVGVRDEEKSHNHLADWSKILPILRDYVIIKYPTNEV